MKRTLHTPAIHELGPCPALRRAQHDHGPARPRLIALQASALLDLSNAPDDDIERRGHRLVHRCRLVSLDEVWLPAISAQQLLELLATDAREQRGIGDFVAIEMQDRQDRAIAGR